MDKDRQQLCSIGIMFPFESDEQAIDYKKKITDLVSEIPNVRIHFSITNTPPPPLST